MSGKKKEQPSNAELIKHRKAGMQIGDIARKYEMDKMDVRDIVRKARNAPKKVVETPAEEPTTGPDVS